MADTLAYSGRPPVTTKGTPWGALLMDPAAAAAYVGLSPVELASLHDAGKIPGVLVGRGVMFRRGDLAKVGQRLGPSKAHRT